MLERVLSVGSYCPRNPYFASTSPSSSFLGTMHTSTLTATAATARPMPDTAAGLQSDRLLPPLATCHNPEASMLKGGLHPEYPP